MKITGKTAAMTDGCTAPFSQGSRWTLTPIGVTRPGANDTFPEFPS
jgi:hypothetical protein